MCMLCNAATDCVGHPRGPTIRARGVAMQLTWHGPGREERAARANPQLPAEQEQVSLHIAGVQAHALPARSTSWHHLTCAAFLRPHHHLHLTCPPECPLSLTGLGREALRMHILRGAAGRNAAAAAVAAAATTAAQPTAQARAPAAQASRSVHTEGCWCWTGEPQVELPRTQAPSGGAARGGQ